MKAICRVAKVKGAGSISGKSDHNYRQGLVPNADPARQALNKEYVLNYENLGKAIEARIGHAGIERTRQDAVKGMEFILTASPETFPRDQAGQVTGDYRNSDWLKANLAFMKQQYGINLIAFTLHQDEKTPHIHAVVVPITTDGRLCAKQLFNPKTLRQLQTDYAQAMKPFGLERGIKGSRAKHVEMKQIYGRQQEQRQTIAEELTPLLQPGEPLQVNKPDMLDLLNLERWKQQQEAQINHQHDRQLTDAQKAAQIAQNMAVANATAKEEVRILQQRLATSEGLKQAHFEKLNQLKKDLTRMTIKLDRIALLVDENRVSKEWISQRAEQVRSSILPQMEKDLLENLKDLRSPGHLADRLIALGYKMIPPEKPRYVEHPITAVRMDLGTTQLAGQPFEVIMNRAIEQTRQQAALKKAQEEARIKQEEETVRRADEKKAKTQQTPKRDRGPSLGHPN